MAETDHGLALRGGVLASLLGDPALIARMAARIFGSQPPAPIPGWPWARVDLADSLPDEASGWIGEDTTFAVNIFTRPSADAPDAEAECRKLVKIAKQRLGSSPIILELEADEAGPVPVVLEMFVRSTRVDSDREEPGAYHGRVEFSAKTVEEA